MNVSDIARRQTHYSALQIRNETKSKTPLKSKKARQSMNTYRSRNILGKIDRLHGDALRSLEIKRADGSTLQVLGGELFPCCIIDKWKGKNESKC